MVHKWLWPVRRTPVGTVYGGLFLMEEPYAEAGEDYEQFPLEEEGEAQCVMN